MDGSPAWPRPPLPESNLLFMLVLAGLAWAGAAPQVPAHTGPGTVTPGETVVTGRDQLLCVRAESGERGHS